MLSIKLLMVYNWVLFSLGNSALFYWIKVNFSSFFKKVFTISVNIYLTQ